MMLAILYNTIIGYEMVELRSGVLYIYYQRL